MSSNSSTDNLCASDDRLCITTRHDLAIIIVPCMLLLFFLITMVPICILRYRPRRKTIRIAAPKQHSNHHNNHHSNHHHSNHHNNHRSSQHRRTQRQNRRPQLQGIDAPPGINPLEHEELPMTAQQVQQNVRPTLAAVPPTPTERQNRGFSQVTALPLSFSIKPDDTVNLYRARMDNRHVVLRALKETANAEERQNFFGFASFLSGLGPHPFIPALLGVVSVTSPPMIVVEELQHRDLLGFLWRCRQDNSGVESSCDMTEKRLFTMAGQVASALEYLHTQGCIHGNVAARSVLVGSDLTAKLWGLGSTYRRRTQANSPGEVGDVELKKWQAPEVLSRRVFSQSSDVWSFGILLYEMVTLGDPPFAQLMGTELLQYLQRGKHLRRPPTCSNSLYSIIKSCSSWNPQQRLSMSELIRKLRVGEQSANERTVLRVSEPLNFEKYLREAGLGEGYNYAVL